MSLDLCLRTGGREVPQALDMGLIGEISDGLSTGVRRKNTLLALQKIKALSDKGVEIRGDTFIKTLELVREYTSKGGIIATAPMLFAAKALDTEGKLDIFGASPLTEYHFGGVHTINDWFYLRKKTVLVIIHGPGLITPENVISNDQSTNSFSPLTLQDHPSMNNLARGRLSQSDSIDIYTLDDVKRDKIPNPFGRYGVVLSGSEIKGFVGRYIGENELSKEEFLNNPIILAVAGTPEYLEALFDKCSGGVKTDINFLYNNRNSFGVEISISKLNLFEKEMKLNNLTITNFFRYFGVMPEAPQ